MDVWKSFVSSRRFWLTIGTVVFSLCGEKLGLTEQQIQEIALLVGAYVVGESLRSSKVGKSNA